MDLDVPRLEFQRSLPRQLGLIRLAHRPVEVCEIHARVDRGRGDGDGFREGLFSEFGLAVCQLKHRQVGVDAGALGVDLDRTGHHADPFVEIPQACQ